MIILRTLRMLNFDDLTLLKRHNPSIEHGIPIMERSVRLDAYLKQTFKTPHRFIHAEPTQQKSAHMRAPFFVVCVVFLYRGVWD